MKFLIILFFFSNIIRADSIFEAYKQGDFEVAEKELILNQVQDPFDPVINYNLGAVQYKKSAFADARESFKKAVDYAEGLLKEHSLFNQGNSLYKNTFSMLGDDWENKKIEDAIFENAITEVKESITSYNTVLELDKESERARVNLEHAEELLKKLEQKKQQQKQDQNKNEQNKNQDKNDQNKNNDKQDKKNNSQDGDDKRDEQKGQDQNKDEQSGKDDKQNKQQDEQQDKQQNGSNEQQDEPNEEKNEQQQEVGGERKEEPQQQNQQQQQGESQENDMELRSMKALLDSLDDREGKLQKLLMRQKNAKAADQSKTMKNW